MTTRLPKPLAPVPKVFVTLGLAVMGLGLLGLAASCAPSEPADSPPAPSNRAPGDTTPPTAAYASPEAKTPSSADTFAPGPVTTHPADIDTTSLVQVPDPLGEDNPRYPEAAMAVPPVGAAFQDPGLGTAVVRVTGRPGIRHEYSRFDPFNADRSMILLLDGDGGFNVYRTTPPYDDPENLVTALDLEEPRWDRSDPSLITGFADFAVVSLNVLTGERTTVKDFADDKTIGPLLAAGEDLYRITTRDEGEASYDGNWWALALQGTADEYRLRYLFCWERSADEVVGLHEVRADQAGIDWVGMSPLGTWVLIGGDPGNGAPLDGFTMADRKLTQFHQLDWATSHADVGLDVSGDEVLVMQNPQTDYVDLLPLDPSTTPIQEDGGSYEGTGHVPLVRLSYASESPLGFDSGLHISCNANGYALVSTHQDAGTPERNWLDRSIILARLDATAPETYYVAKIHNVTEEYWEETHGTISNDGGTVVWAADFGVDPGSLQTYLLRLDLSRR